MGLQITGGSDPAAGPPAVVRVRTHPALCLGWGNCHRWAPEVYPLDDEGLIAVHLLEVPESQAIDAWRGASVCPDCLGHGRAPRGAVMEWRLRDLERAHAGHKHGCENDIQWLVHELRRHRDALIEVLTRCQDAGDTSAVVVDIRHVANEALGLYQPEPP